ncbi:MAG: TonB family protein [Pseudomonadota bacterium]
MIARYIHLPVAFVLALAVHVAAFGIRPADEGLQSGGSGGEGLVSVKAASASIAAMVQDWETPPDVAPTEIALEATSAPETPTVMPTAQPEVPPDNARPQSMALPTPEVEVSPDVTATAQAIPTPEIDTTSTPLTLALPQAPASPKLTALPQQPVPQPARPPGLAPPPPPPTATPKIDTTPPPIPRLNADGNVQRSTRPQAKPDTVSARAAAAEALKRSEALREPPPPRQNSQASRAQTQQRAAGSGGGSNAGTANTARAATVTQAQSASLQRQWGAAIQARVSRASRDPRAAGGVDGRVIIRLNVTTGGGLAGVGIVRSSGNAALDQAALAAARRARYPAAPSGLTASSYSFDIPIAFNG